MGNFTVRAVDAGIGLFLVGSAVVLGSFLKRSRKPDPDRTVAETTMATRNETSKAIARTVGQLGSKKARLVFTVIGLGIALPSPRAVGRLLLGAAAAFGGEMGLKYLLDVPRPPPPIRTEKKETPTFPSGHATSLVLPWAISGMLPNPERALVRAGAVAVAAISSAARVYVGVHWASDTLGGIAFGIGMGAAIDALLPPTV